jgi:hypothetical protein
MQSVTKRAAALGVAAAAAIAMQAAPAGASTSSSHAAKISSAAQPSSVARAGTVGFKVNNGKCFANKITFTAKTYETGRSGVQRFRQKAVLQEFRGGRWVNRATSTKASTKFPNNAVSYSYTLNWTGTHTANGSSWREVWQGFYLNGWGGVIAKTKKITLTCF